jgi:hypothetical protein
MAKCTLDRKQQLPNRVFTRLAGITVSNTTGTSQKEYDKRHEALRTLPIDMAINTSWSAVCTHLDFTKIRLPINTTKNQLTQLIGILAMVCYKPASRLNQTTLLIFPACRPDLRL